MLVGLAVVVTAGCRQDGSLGTTPRAAATASGATTSARPGASASAPAAHTAPGTSGTVAPTGGVGAAVPAVCEGRALDLDHVIDPMAMALVDAPTRHLVAGGPCAVADDELPPTPTAAALALELETAALRPGAGARVEVTVVLENHTGERLAVPLRGCVAPAGLASVEVLRGGERADLLPTDIGCGLSRGCQPWAARVVLAPSGHATLTASFDAVMHRLESDCSEKPAGPLAPGTYDLVVTTPLPDPAAAFVGAPGRRASGTLTIAP